MEFWGVVMFGAILWVASRVDRVADRLDRLIKLAEDQRNHLERIADAQVEEDVDDDDDWP